MAWQLKNCTQSKVPRWPRAAKCAPIGVDIADDAVKLAQLSDNGKGINLVYGGIKCQPPEVKTGSGNWQRWAVGAIRELTTTGKFRARDVVAGMPPGDVCIDHIRMPRIKDSASEEKTRDAIFSAIRQKLPFEPAEAMLRYIPADENNVVVISAARVIVDRHLAIYENAGLQIKSIAVWPLALINTYTRFFGRRKTDMEATVTLLGIDANRTNVVICRHKNLLFARSITIGAKHLDHDEMVTRLVLELTACRRHFCSMYKKTQIQRLLFLSGQAGVKNICATIARQLETPAQMGDCLAAVQIADPSTSGIDRRDCQVNWATAFGLSLS